MAQPNGWVGFDLDGTLAIYEGWKGPEHIGEPIMPMVEYAKTLIAAGIEIRIVTARASTARMIEDEEMYDKVISSIRQWCWKHLGKRVEITAEKDFEMILLIDDRVATVELNTGRFLSPLVTVEELIEKINFHFSSNNPKNPAYVADETV